MASKKGAKKPAPLTREQVGAMSHKELSSVKTKRRLMASLPSAEKPKAAGKPKPKADENVSPYDRMRRGHQVREEARKGGTDGEQD